MRAEVKSSTGKLKPLPPAARKLVQSLGEQFTPPVQVWLDERVESLTRPFIPIDGSALKQALQKRFPQAGEAEVNALAIYVLAKTAQRMEEIAKFSSQKQESVRPVRERPGLRFENLSQRQSEIMELISKFLKVRHDAPMSSIRSLR